MMFVMNIQTITCSGPNEKVKLAGLLRLFTANSIAEMGVQCSGKTTSVGTERYEWIKQLFIDAGRIQQNLRAALHINTEWCEDFCRGNVARELSEFMAFRHNGAPFFSRIQLNFSLPRNQTITDRINPKDVADVILSYPSTRFILPCNIKTIGFIEKVAEFNVVFDVLYDSSFGEGISPDRWEAPVFKDRFQGYAGGLSPENIVENLDKISQVVPTGTDIFVDAEGNLKDEAGAFDLAKARRYIQNVTAWMQRNK